MVESYGGYTRGWVQELLGVVSVDGTLGQEDRVARQHAKAYENVVKAAKSNLQFSSPN